MADQQGLGRWALSVPLEDWQRLRGKYPDLASTDAAIKSRAWLEFIASPEAAPFRCASGYEHGGEFGFTDRGRAWPG